MPFLLSTNDHRVRQQSPIPQGTHALPGREPAVPLAYGAPVTPEFRQFTICRPRPEFSRAPVPNESGTDYLSAAKFRRIAPIYGWLAFEPAVHAPASAREGSGGQEKR
jgi:hypothetical protein